MTLSKSLKSKGVKGKLEASKPSSVWEGPHSSGPQGGITQSLLSEFLCCRERFRLRVVEGLGLPDSFNHRMEYGSMWHVCEEALGECCRATYPKPVPTDWREAVKKYAQELCRKYPLQQEQVRHWYNVCLVQFPLYLDHWKKHPDVVDRKVLLPEVSFKIPYVLPSARIVWLRGKWDSVDLIGKGKEAGVYLQENKTKGDINEEQLKRQLQFDLQTGFYLTALTKLQEAMREGFPEVDVEAIRPEAEHVGGVPELLKTVRGVCYNVVRRPLSGGKGSIRKHQPTKSNPSGESDEEFYSRLGGVLSEEPGYWFMRWKSEVTPTDLQKFQNQFLNPILEQLCDWWVFVTQQDNPWNPPSVNGLHWRLPYGIYNVIAEGGATELDHYLDSGDALGLERGKPLFSELD